MELSNEINESSLMLYPRVALPMFMRGQLLIQYHQLHNLRQEAWESNQEVSLEWLPDHWCGDSIPMRQLCLLGLLFSNFSYLIRSLERKLLLPNKTTSNLVFILSKYPCQEHLTLHQLKIVHHKPMPQTILLFIYFFHYYCIHYYLLININYYLLLLSPWYMLIFAFKTYAGIVIGIHVYMFTGFWNN